MDAFTIEQAKADARRFYEQLNRVLTSGDLAKLDQVIAPDAVDHNPVPGMQQCLEGEDGIAEGGLLAQLGLAEVGGAGPRSAPGTAPPAPPS